MPRPCAVESHARRYQLLGHTPPLPPDATALRRGVSRSPLIKTSLHSSRCHGLAPWSLALAATNYLRTHPSTLPDATALRRGVSRSPLPLLGHTPPLFQ